MCVLHMCDFRSRTARNLALDNGFLVLFAALRARGRPEIDFDYLFKAKKVTLREDSSNLNSPGRPRYFMHRFISLRKLMFLCVFNENRKSAKHTYLLSYFDTFGGSESPEIENPPKRLPFKAKTHAFWDVFCGITENASRKVAKNNSNYCPFYAPGGNTKRLRFSTPLMLFGHFVNFWNPHFQKGQIPLEG